MRSLSSNLVRRLLIWAGIAVAIVSLTAGCASSLLPARKSTTPSPAVANHSSVSIGVLEEGWHTGLVVSVPEAGPLRADLHRQFPDARYLVFGWGNRAFYTAARPGVGTAITALFPSASVIFVRGLTEAPNNELPSSARLRWLCASRLQVRKLDRFLADYLQKGHSGHPISIAPGPWPHSRFFASTGTYDAFHTCNTWTAAGLEFAGFPVDAQGVLFAWQVMSGIRALHACHNQE